MIQQPGILISILKTVNGIINDVSGVDIWVMDPMVKSVDDAKPLMDTQLYRVKGVQGVGWAVPFYKGSFKVHMANRETVQSVAIGLDDATLIGGPGQLLHGSLWDLRQPDSIIVDKAGAEGRLAKARPGEDPGAVAACIARQTGLGAYSAQQFKAKNLEYMVKNTSIIMNFGFVVLVGFVVGAAVTGQIFYNFTLDNLRHFGVFKAMGATDGMLRRLILLQAMVVGLIGFGLGAGFTSLFALNSNSSDLGMTLNWALLSASGGAVLVIILLAALLSIRKVMKLEPAIVFKG